MTGFDGKRVVVVGLARSGVAAAHALLRLGATVTVNDRKEAGELRDFITALDPGVTVVVGGHPAELLDSADIIVVSPGVPTHIGPLRRASGKGVKIIGELELAYTISRAIHSEKRTDKGETGILAITGTNGKSTTTMLVYEMLRNSGNSVIVGGNIGAALTGRMFRPEEEMVLPDFIVAEVSSFQLETIDTFRPQAAAILNITPDHLDRYGSMPDYIAAKCGIFLNQTKDDHLILNADDPLTEEILKRLQANGKKAQGLPHLHYFSRQRQVEGAYLMGGAVHFNTPFTTPGFCLDPANFRIKGLHNVENAMTAALLALSVGCSQAAVEKTIIEFPGLEHRLEPVREIGGVRYINDSKGTNTGAVMKSLEGFSEPVILIAGGRDKDGDFSLLAPLVKDGVKALILIGEAADKIARALDGSTLIFREEGLDGAVLKAHALALAGDVVLLSPACASFDMFRDFEHRGRCFKEAVMRL